MRKQETKGVDFAPQLPQHCFWFWFCISGICFLQTSAGFIKSSWKIHGDEDGRLCGLLTEEKLFPSLGNILLAILVLSLSQRRQTKVVAINFKSAVLWPIVLASLSGQTKIFKPSLCWQVILIYLWGCPIRVGIKQLTWWGLILHHIVARHATQWLNFILVSYLL